MVSLASLATEVRLVYIYLAMPAPSSAAVAHANHSHHLSLNGPITPCAASTSCTAPRAATPRAGDAPSRSEVSGEGPGHDGGGAISARHQAKVGLRASSAAVRTSSCDQVVGRSNGVRHHPKPLHQMKLPRVLQLPGAPPRSQLSPPTCGSCIRPESADSSSATAMGSSSLLGGAVLRCRHRTWLMTWLTWQACTAAGSRAVCWTGCSSAAATLTC